MKESFGRNSVALRISGGEKVLRDPNLVSKLEEHSDEVEALLAPNASAQVLLKALIDAGAQVMKFELVEPSLHDIFIQKIGEAK